MSCRFCGTAERTVRVVAYDPIVTYACGTEFFTTEQEIGEPLDKCWSQSQECKAKAPVKEDGKRAARLDTYPVSHVEALETRLAELEAEAKQARDDEAWALDAAVTIHPDGASKSFAPMFWSVRYWDGVRTLDVTATTIRAALRPLRAKVEGGKR